jgi:hypothetical protein
VGVALLVSHFYFNSASIPHVHFNFYAHFRSATIPCSPRFLYTDAMIYTRGSKDDYNSWGTALVSSGGKIQDENNGIWSWDALWPWMKKVRLHMFEATRLTELNLCAARTLETPGRQSFDLGSIRSKVPRVRGKRWCVPLLGRTVCVRLASYESQ